MRLPNLDKAFVEAQKITGYLLSEENSGGKSAFFAAMGFRPTLPDVLRDALLTHAATHEVNRRSETRHGVKYIVDGAMQMPVGRSAQVRTIWIIDAGQDAPRFVTAYPLEGDNR